MGRISRLRRGATVTLLTTAQLPLALGPATAEGLTASLTISERLQSIEEEGFSNNEGARSLTSFGFSLNSENRNQRLSLGINTGLSYNFSDNDDGLEFEDTSLQLSYTVENRNTELSFNSSYRRSDVDDAVFFDELLEEEVLTGGGRREIYALNTGLTWGREGPFTATLGHIYTESNFSDTTDPDLVDVTTQGLNANVSFEITPVLTLNAFASWREVDREGVGANDQTNRSYGVGASYAINGSTSLNASLSDSNNDSTNSGENGGLGFSVGLNRNLSNGALKFSLSQQETINDTRREILVSRQLELQRGSLSFGIGATKTDGLSAQPLASLGLNYEINRLNQLNVSLEQSASVDGDDNETVTTRLGVGYTRSLTELSSLGAGLRLVDQNVLGAGGTDRTSISFDVTYRYDMGSDWDLVTGYEYSSVRRDALEDRNTRTLFLGVERSFDFRP